MEYLRDRIKLKKSVNVFTVRLDDETIQKIDLLSEYFNVRKGELIKLGLSYIDTNKIKKKLLEDSEHKLIQKCNEGTLNDMHTIKSETTT